MAIIISDFVLQNALNDIQRLRNGIRDILLLWQIMKVWAKRKSIHPPYHALVMTSEGEITETNMNDIEISIVQKYWIRNKKLMEQAYA